MNIELDDIRSPEPAATSRLVGSRTAAPTLRAIRQKSSAAIHRISRRQQHDNRQNDTDRVEDAASPAQVTYGGHTVPPPDRGRGAYLVLVACSLAQAPIWGIFRLHALFFSDLSLTIRLLPLVWRLPAVLCHPQLDRRLARQRHLDWHFANGRHVLGRPSRHGRLDSIPAPEALVWSLGFGYFCRQHCRLVSNRCQ